MGNVMSSLNNTAENYASEKVTVKMFADKMQLTCLTPEIDLSKRQIGVYDINRPALQLTGFFAHFESKRVQIVGKVEQQYIDTLQADVVEEAFRKLTNYNVPCVVFSRNYKVSDKILGVCRKNGVPVLVTGTITSELSSETIRWLKEKLAPSIVIHGVLVDVYGEGVLIRGDSGIGKSEAALELIKRGHRLVSDDVVEIKKVSDDILVGQAPASTRDFIELRGIGIVNVRALFGFEAIKETQNIDMVINLEDWDREKKYDRIGIENNYTEILGNKVISYEIPIRPGRNLAVIVESAAVNNRARKMGYNSGEEIMKRLGGLT